MTGEFPTTSRYVLIEVATYESADGRETAYLRRRFVPPPERFTPLQSHAVTEGDRLDNVTFAYLGDSEQFWRIADANRAMRPDDLMKIGRSIRITLPEGITGATSA